MEKKLKLLYTKIEKSPETVPISDLHLLAAAHVEFWTIMRKLYEKYGRGHHVAIIPMNIPSAPQIETSLNEWQTLHTFVKDMTSSIKVPVSLFTYTYVYNRDPKRTLKVIEHRQMTKVWYSYIDVVNGVYIIKNNSPSLPKVKRPVKKQVNKQASKTSLGHKSFGRNRTNRLIAEAKDPPGYLIVSRTSLPRFKSYKYMSTVFHLRTPKHKGADKCKIVCFDSVDHRNKIVKAKHCKYFDLSLFM